MSEATPGGAAATATPAASTEAPKTETPAVTAPKGEAPKADPPKAEKPAAPEKYEFKLPDGVQLDETFAGKASSVFKELGFTQDVATKLVALQGDYMAEIVKQGAAERAQWAEQLKAHKEFGGDKMDATVRAAQKFINTFGAGEEGEALKALLERDGYGNHPGLVIMLARAAKHFDEDTFFGDGPPGAPKESAQEAELRRMYPSMFEKKAS
jgi:hypothetical protein